MHLFDCPYCKRDATSWKDILGNFAFFTWNPRCYKCDKDLKINIATFFMYYMGGALFGFATAMLYAILIGEACRYYEMLILGKNTFLCGFLIFPLLAVTMYCYSRILGDKLKVRMFRPRE